MQSQFAICFAVAMPLVTTVFAGEISPIVIAILITTGASYAFATAPATPPAAIIADSGWVESGKMLKYGMIAAVIAVVCIATIGQALAGVFADIKIDCMSLNPLLMNFSELFSAR